MPPVTRPAPPDAGLAVLVVTAPEPAPTPVADANHVRGADATDFPNGTGSNDTIDGGAGDDFLQGAGGADRLADGPGDDMLMGGGGADHFVFTAEDTGRDVVFDFRHTEGDRTDLHAIFGGGTLAEHVAAGQLAVTQLGGDVAVQVDVAGDHPVTVVDLQEAQFAGLGSDFILVWAWRGGRPGGCTRAALWPCLMHSRVA